MSESDTNEHGLARYIPSDVRREVRKRVGFGCVICGSAFYQYEHFDPDFKDARKHEAVGITLLCGGCHDKVTRRAWSKNKVRRHNHDPRCLQTGFARDLFDIGDDPPIVAIGGMELQNCPTLLRIEGTPVLRVERPEFTGQPFLVSGYFCDSAGESTLIIERNEFQTPVGSWDVETVGTTISIRSGLGEFVLQVELVPPSQLRITRIDMKFHGVQIRGDDKSPLEVVTSNGNKTTVQARTVNFEGDAPQFAIDVTNGKITTFGVDGGAALTSGGNLVLENVTFRTGPPPKESPAK